MPSVRPSISPIETPSISPTQLSTVRPSLSPSRLSASPSSRPTSFPSQVPIMSPSTSPIQLESESPSIYPSTTPSLRTTYLPTQTPIDSPSISPIQAQTSRPSSYPTTISPSTSPSARPSLEPTHFPSMAPIAVPTISPSIRPILSISTVLPTKSPSSMPTLDATTLSPTLSKVSLSPASMPSLEPVAFPMPFPTIDNAHASQEPTTSPHESSERPSQWPSTYNSTIGYSEVDSVEKDGGSENESLNAGVVFGVLFPLAVVLAAGAFAYANEKKQREEMATALSFQELEDNYSDEEAHGSRAIGEPDDDDSNAQNSDVVNVDVARMLEENKELSSNLIIYKREGPDATFDALAEPEASKIDKETEIKADASLSSSAKQTLEQTKNTSTEPIDSLRKHDVLDIASEQREIDNIDTHSETAIAEVLDRQGIDTTNIPENSREPQTDAVKLAAAAALSSEVLGDERETKMHTSTTKSNDELSQKTGVASETSTTNSGQNKEDETTNTTIPTVISQSSAQRSKSQVEMINITDESITSVKSDRIGSDNAVCFKSEESTQLFGEQMTVIEVEGMISFVMLQTSFIYTSNHLFFCNI